MKKVFVIGGMKCGTSSLYQMFKGNEEVCLSKFKEPSYFTKRTDNTLEWYESQFEITPKTKLTMDVSPSYSKVQLFPECAKKIHKYAPDAKIIYLVRDPLERIISNVYHDLLRGRLKNSTIKRELQKEDKYIKTSRYMMQITPYIELFGEENVLVLQFEDLKTNLPAFNKKLADFLEIDVNVEKVEAQNVSESRYLIKYYDFVHKTFGNGLISKMYHLFWRAINKKVKKPKLSTADIDFIIHRLGKDIEIFIEKFNIDESAWKLWSSRKKDN